MLRKCTRNLIAVVAIAVAATLAAAALSRLRAVRDLESVAYDLRVLAFAPPTKPSDAIVLVWLDEATMQGLPYRSPVPRDFLATLHGAIMKAQPWMVAYDVFFKDPSFPDADRALERAIAGTTTYAVAPMREDGAVDRPLPAFAELLTGVGLADLPFNPFDATVRTARLRYATKEGPFPTFAALLATAAAGDSAEAAIRDEAKAPGIGPLSTTPFLGDGGEFFIRFSAPPGKSGSAENAFKSYSAALVAKGLIPAAWLAEKIVLVGAAYEDLKDTYATPYFARATRFARMSGVELHANILSSLLTGQFYYALRPWQGVALLLAVSLLVALPSALAGPFRAALAALGVAALEVAGAVACFRAFGVVLPVVSPLIAAGLSCGAGLGFQALTEGRSRRYIKSAFARYVPPAVVERLSEDPEGLKLGGEQRDVTSLFSDIASFTSISERMDPQTLVGFLNEYLGRMNEELFRRGATLDKYEGDAIIAFFNAPLVVPDHARAAVLAALGMRRVDREISAAWSQRLGREVVTRIGLNAGPAVVGNVGSEGRFDYTAIGDTINLASRLEGANKFYGTTILAAEPVIAALAESALPILSRPVDRVRVKGKQVPIRLYEVVGERAEIGAELMGTLFTPYLEAVELLEAARLSEARTLAEKILSAHPADGPTASLLKRCDRAQREPEWDLVTDLTSK